jgi:hypothetical protein
VTIGQHDSLGDVVRATATAASLSTWSRPRDVAMGLVARAGRSYHVRFCDFGKERTLSFLCVRLRGALLYAPSSKTSAFSFTLSHLGGRSPRARWSGDSAALPSASPAGRPGSASAPSGRALPRPVSGRVPVRSAPALARRGSRPAGGRALNPQHYIQHFYGLQRRQSNS